MVFFILDLDWNGTYTRINTISAKGYGTSNNCGMPGILDVVVSNNNSTYFLTKHYKNSHTTSSNYPCLWSPSGSSPWYSVNSNIMLWMHDSSGVSSWWVKTGYSGVTVATKSHLMVSPNLNGVVLYGDSGTQSNNNCGYSPPTGCTFHYHSSDGNLVSNHPHNAKLGYALPYVSIFNSTGSHLQTEIVDIDDNDQYYREEYVTLTKLKQISDSALYLGFSYQSDYRANTENATFLDQNLTSGRINGFIIDISGNSFSINTTLNIDNEIPLLGLNNYTHLFTNSGAQISAFAGNSSLWDTSAYFGGILQTQYDIPTKTITVDSFVSIDASTRNFGNLSILFPSDSYYHLLMTYSLDYDGDDLGNSLDNDDDGDGIDDIYDNCPLGLFFNSNLFGDRDGDGCQDSSEDC